MIVTVDLPESVVSLLGLPVDASADAVKERLESFAKAPYLDLETSVGKVRVGFDTCVDTEACVSVIPKDSCPFTLFQGFVADNGDIKMQTFADPASPYNTGKESIKYSAYRNLRERI